MIGSDERMALIVMVMTTAWAWLQTSFGEAVGIGTVIGLGYYALLKAPVMWQRWRRG